MPEQNTLCGLPIRPGVLGNISSQGIGARLIRMALGRSYNRLTGQPRRNCPTHTFMIVRYDGQLWIADVVSPRSKLTSLAEYEADCADGRRWAMQLFEPGCISDEAMLYAADWWIEHRLGRPYDWPAFGRLGLKALFGDIFPSSAGLEWADWCTESFMLAYLNGPGLDLFRNLNPTPVTLVKRWRDEIFHEITQ